MPVELDYERTPLELSPDVIDSKLVVNPSRRAALQSLGLTCSAALLNLPGEIVSGHPDRHVMRVELADGTAAFLKREHRIRWKDRWRNLCDGFGWTSKSIREGIVLRELQALKLPVPYWLAFGEDDTGRAFLLIEEVAGANDLRHPLSEMQSELLPDQLAHLCARLHLAQIDHPDLGAKHLLLANRDLTVLDWQRATLGQAVSWPRRLRSLAHLLATLPRLKEDERRRFLNSYRENLLAGFESGVPEFDSLRQSCESLRRSFLKRRQVHDQGQPPLDRHAQRLVWLDGEALCAIPEATDELGSPAVRATLHNPACNGQYLQLNEGTVTRLEVCRRLDWPGRLLAFVRRKCWRAPELRKARLLFHLERYRVPAPKLFAYGQRCSTFGSTAFVLAEAIQSRPLAESLRDADDDQRYLLLRQLFDTIGRLHRAGCTAGSPDAFGIHSGDDCLEIVVTHPERLGFHRHVSERARTADIERIVRAIGPGCVATGFEQTAEVGR